MNGILLIDKPAGWTSHDVVAKLRGILGERRIGHSGTLDPMATGLLAVFIGKATKAVEFAEADEKEYIAGLRLGLVTDTQDTTGTQLSVCRPDVGGGELEAALARFRGEQDQVPPMYSAVKVGGQRLYQIARRGGEVERAPRRITIRELELLSRSGDEVRLRVVCSKGTYIRTLCHDIGAALGCGGCMSSLRRIRAGAFSVGAALTLGEVAELAAKGEAERALLEVDALFSDLPALILNTPAAEKAVRNGAAFTAPGLADGEYRVYSAAGEFLTLSRAGGGAVSAVKNFF